LGYYTATVFFNCTAVYKNLNFLIDRAIKKALTTTAATTRNIFTGLFHKRQYKKVAQNDTSDLDLENHEVTQGETTM
jgi:hypothetical protein